MLMYSMVRPCGGVRKQRAAVTIGAVRARRGRRSPNIVYFVTDDQDQTSAVLLFYAFIF